MASSIIILSPRDDDDDVVYYDPAGQIYAGLWTLFAGASGFLALRLWCKLTRRHGLWYDDYILISAYLVLFITDSIITYEYANGYAKGDWDDTMHILINTSSIGTVIGQAVSKTAFGVTLLRMVESRWQAAFLWFCIVSMDGIAFSKCIFQWARLCDKDDYQQWYRISGWCLNYAFQNNWKEIGNIYNIVMDFIFALFPWFITWKLNLKKAEKIGLCITLSLGIVVAVITAVRTWWKDTPLMHVHDEWYMWRDAVSQIWYSAEVAGTIIVQCIPVLRPFVKDLHNSLTSRRLAATDDPTGKGGGSTWRGSTLLDKKGLGPEEKSSILSRSDEENQKANIIGGGYELSEIPEEALPPSYRGHQQQQQQQQQQQHTFQGFGHHADAYYSPSEVDLRIQASHTKPVPPRRDNAANWPL